MPSRQIEMIQIQLNASSQTNNQASLQQGQRLDQLRECITQLQRDSQRQSAATDQVVDLAARMVGLMTRSRETTKEVAFLSSLADETMRSRHATVGDAAGGTFEWIWQSGLSQWLESRSSSRVFWIAGKPGSGKSTLMKYIVDHDKLVGLLSKWVAPRDVSVVSHFFWYVSEFFFRLVTSTVYRVIVVRCLTKPPSWMAKPYYVLGLRERICKSLSGACCRA